MSKKQKQNCLNCIHFLDNHKNKKYVFCSYGSKKYPKKNFCNTEVSKEYKCINYNETI